MKPGFYKLTRAEYDAADGIRNTEVGWAAICMAKYKHFKAVGRKATEAKDDGILIHRAILEPDVFERTTVVIPDDAPKKPTKAQINAKKPSPESLASVAWWHDFGCQHSGKAFMDKGERQWIQDIAAAVLAHPEARDIIASCKRQEMAVFSRHEATGLLLKSQFDLLTDDDSEIWDIKKTRNAEPEAYRKDFTFYGYHRQAAFYPDHFPRLGLKTPTFGQIIVEDEAPYVVSVRPVDEESIDAGRKEYRTLLHKIANAIQTGNYPGYHEGRSATGLSLWKLKEVLG